ARELVETAHRQTKEALADLRELVRGIHPPILDNGLADALTTVVAGSAIPTTLAVDLPVRPTPAIEPIAYFCLTDLLANAVKHSGAAHIDVTVGERDATLVATVTDDGTGGAVIGPSGGLAGLTERVSTVDGRLTVPSPMGGPTRATVELPLKA